MLAMDAFVAGRAGTLVAVNLVQTTGTVLARLYSTIVNVHVAVLSSPTFVTDALSGEELVHADTVQAGRMFT